MQSNQESLAKIELREFSIIGAATHQFFVLYNEHGQVEYELHGGAVDQNSGHYKPISFGFGDPLKVILYSATSNTIFSRPGFYGLYKDTQEAKTLITAADDNIIQRWDAALEAAKFWINA